MKETDTKCRQGSQGLILLLVISWTRVDAALAKADSEYLFQSHRLPIWQCSGTDAQLQGVDAALSAGPWPQDLQPITSMEAARGLDCICHWGRAELVGGRNVEANQRLVFQLCLLPSML